MVVDIEVVRARSTSDSNSHARCLVVKKRRMNAAVVAAVVIGTVVDYAIVEGWAWGS